jgi:poly-gamma-glutamate capsule biosynthesis protein CapA/YwtB (metallophosphatase superfamily)
MFHTFYSLGNFVFDVAKRLFEDQMKAVKEQHEMEKQQQADEVRRLQNQLEGMKHAQPEERKLKSPV